jgi:hypothetical protein
LQDKRHAKKVLSTQIRHKFNQNLTLFSSVTSNILLTFPLVQTLQLTENYVVTDAESGIKNLLIIFDVGNPPINPAHA